MNRLLQIQMDGKCAPNLVIKLHSPIYHKNNNNHAVVKVGGKLKCYYLLSRCITKWEINESIGWLSSYWSDTIVHVQNGQWTTVSVVEDTHFWMETILKISVNLKCHCYFFLSSGDWWTHSGSKSWFLLPHFPPLTRTIIELKFRLFFKIACANKIS